MYIYIKGSITKIKAFTFLLFHTNKTTLPQNQQAAESPLRQISISNQIKLQKCSPISSQCLKVNTCRGTFHTNAFVRSKSTMLRSQLCCNRGASDARNNFSVCTSGHSDLCSTQQLLTSLFPLAKNKKKEKKCTYIR